jgi:hypothetical protein
MHKPLLFTIILALGCTCQAASADNAGKPNCCAHCARQVACMQKTCQVVCDVKKETKTYWTVECQEICPLLPGHHDCQSCCPPPPRCGEPKCVKKLVKKEYQVEVPIYKCVVKYLCMDCRNGAGAPPPAPIPTIAPPSKADRPLPKAPEAPPTPPIPSATPKPTQSAAILPSLQ